MYCKMARQVVPLVLLCLATRLCSASGAIRPSKDIVVLQEPSPRTLYGSPQEKFSQILAYHKLKAAVKTQALECYKRSFCQMARALAMAHSKMSAITGFMRGAAEMHDSFTAAFAKGWTGQNCTKAYRSCDLAKDYVGKLVDVIMNTKPNVK